MKRKQTIFKRVNVAFASILSAILALKVFLEKDNVSELYIFVSILVDLFFIEAILYVLIVVFSKQIYLFIIDLKEAILFINSHKEYKQRIIKRYLFFYISVPIIVAILISFSCYTSYKIVQGKYIHITNYDRVLTQKAENSFYKLNNIALAKKYLNVCVKLFSSYMCANRLNSLDSRVEEAKFFKRFYETISENNTYAKIKIIEDIHYLDRNLFFYWHNKDIIKKNFETTRRSYTDALNSILNTRYDDAYIKLTKINRNIPNYGASKKLLYELKDILNGQENFSSPYLNSLRKLGTQDFIVSTSHDFDSLTKQFLSGKVITPDEFDLENEYW